MKMFDLNSIKAYLMEHKVPEERIRTATAKICALELEAAGLHQKVKTARTARAANLALKRAKQIVAEVEDIVVEMLDDAKSESMRRTGRKKNENDTQEKDQ